jgi:hypothetical protein
MPSAALEPHPATPSAILRSMSVRIERVSEALQVVYVLEGEMARLRIPERRAPRAAERLWEHTCCELFIGRPGESSYREFNFSPSTQWAAYEFTAYRDRPRALDVSARIHVEQTADSLELQASVPWKEPGKLIVGISAVIEERDGTRSYWALRHAPGKPDFHHRDAFALELE